MQTQNPEPSILTSMSLENCTSHTFTRFSYFLRMIFITYNWFYKHFKDKENCSEDQASVFRNTASIFFNRKYPNPEYLRARISTTECLMIISPRYFALRTFSISDIYCPKLGFSFYYESYLVFTRSISFLFNIFHT